MGNQCEQTCCEASKLESKTEVETNEKKFIENIKPFYGNDNKQLTMLEQEQQEFYKKYAQSNVLNNTKPDSAKNTYNSQHFIEQSVKAQPVYSNSPNKNQIKPAMNSENMTSVYNKQSQPLAQSLNYDVKSKSDDAIRYFTQEEQLEAQINQTSNYRETRGPFKFKSGAIYIGEWFDGKRDGKGTQQWPDGAKYEGDWVKNRAYGRGKFWHIDGDTFEGEWKNDQANGFGTYTHTNGAKYEGNWKNDLQHGIGVESWADESKYEGDYVEGKKEGQGTYLWSDGSKYVGKWKDNKIGGFGIYTWLDGRKYEGNWEDNNMHGHGVYIWKDGRKYEGEYQNDKKHGYGSYTWADGRKYVGQWEFGKQHGKGKYLLTDGSVRNGYWENGVRIKWLDDQEEQQSLGTGIKATMTQSITLPNQQLIQQQTQNQNQYQKVSPSLQQQSPLYKTQTLNTSQSPKLAPLQKQQSQTNESQFGKGVPTSTSIINKTEQSPSHEQNTSLKMVGQMKQSNPLNGQLIPLNIQQQNSAGNSQQQNASWNQTQLNTSANQQKQNLQMQQLLY